MSVPAANLQIQPPPEEVAAFAPAGLGEAARALPASAEDVVRGRERFEVVVGGWLFEAVVESADRAELFDRARRQGDEQHVGGEITVRAQIPGRIARIWVAEGDAVEQGQRLLAIEAMKMENEIRAPHAGIVRAIRVETGSKVERDDELLSVGQ